MKTNSIKKSKKLEVKGKKDTEFKKLLNLGK